jgi:hypothetical protein
MAKQEGIFSTKGLQSHICPQLPGIGVYEDSYYQD